MLSVMDETKREFVLGAGVATRQILTSGSEADVLRKSTSVSHFTKGDSHMLLTGSCFGGYQPKLAIKTMLGFG